MTAFQRNISAACFRESTGAGIRFRSRRTASTLRRNRSLAEEALSPLIAAALSSLGLILKALDFGGQLLGDPNIPLYREREATSLRGEHGSSSGSNKGDT